MNVDPFGHIACARHFQGAAKRELAQSKTPESKKIWQLHIDTIEARIKKMEADEIEYWATL